MPSRRAADRQAAVAASVAALIALPLVLAGCGGGGGRAAGAAAREAPGGQAQPTADTPVAHPPGGSAASGGTSPPPTARAAEPSDTGGVAAALAVLQDYYAAISAGDYSRAYADWADEGRASGKTEAQLRKGFAATAEAVLLPGTPGRIEGAAGSRYIDVPVTVRARTTAGVAQCFEGTYTLRRVVVEGAPPEARRWHIYRGELRDRPAAACAGAPAPAVTAWPAPRTSARASAGMSRAA